MRYCTVMNQLSTNGNLNRSKNSRTCTGYASIMYQLSVILTTNPLFTDRLLVIMCQLLTDVVIRIA